MRNTILSAILAFGFLSINVFSDKIQAKTNKELVKEKLDIKLKNDTDNQVKVINAGSGGSYSLAVNTTTIIKMEEGDKLYYYEKGKKGALLLVATSEMNGKLQLLTKL